MWVRFILTNVKVKYFAEILNFKSLITKTLIKTSEAMTDSDNKNHSSYS